MNKYKRLTRRFRNLAGQDDIELFATCRVGIERLAELEDKIEQGKLVELPFLLKTSSKFACVVWKDNQGVIHKTHTFPIEQAEARLKELQGEE